VVLIRCEGTIWARILREAEAQVRTWARGLMQRHAYNFCMMLFYNGTHRSGAVLLDMPRAIIQQCLMAIPKDEVPSQSSQPLFPLYNDPEQVTVQ
jgi:hypothetical protein